MQALLVLICAELAVLLGVLFLSAAKLRLLRLSNFLLLIPGLLVALSSPLLLLLERFWVEAGWQVAHVINLYWHMNLVLILLLCLVAVIPRKVKSKSIIDPRLT